MSLFKRNEPSATIQQKPSGKMPENRREADTETRDVTMISARAEIKDAVLVVPEEDVEIRGRWTGAGRIICNTLHVMQGAVVEGTVLAKRMKVAGKVRGEIAAGLLILTDTADIEGSIRCRQMSTQPKARVRATLSCDTGEAIGDMPATNETIDAIQDIKNYQRLAKSA
jgi:cytoskeletal protein CcmA (bactofilin family)